MIDGILWALSDGGRWRNLPERFGPWQSVFPVPGLPTSSTFSRRST